MANRILLTFGAILGVLLLMVATVFAFPSSAEAAETKVVYLTFDDGPSLDSVSQDVLDVLEEFDVKATFFVVGDAIRTNPAAFQAMLEGGHAIGNHSNTHPRLSELAAAEVAAEFDLTQQAVTEAGGPTMTCYRPPYGATNDTVRALSAERGMSEILWEADGEDYRRPLPSVEEIVDNLNLAVDGDTLILHDGVNGQANTAPALRQWLTDHGDEYEFRLVSDCVGGAGQSDARAVANCVAKLVDGRPVLTWTPTLNDNASSYKIRRDQDSKINETVVATVVSGTTSWVDPSGFNASNAYRIDTVAANGTTARRTCGPAGGLVAGDPVDPAPVDPEPVNPDPVFEAPANCAAVVDGTSIDVTWTEAPGAERYVIYRTVNGSRQYWRGNVAGLSFVDANRTATIEYFVASKSAEGTKSNRTKCSFDPGVGTEPAAVASCTVTRARQNNVTVSWTGAEDADFYVIYRTVDDSPQYWRGRVAAGDTTFADTTRRGDISYFVAAKYGATFSNRVACDNA